MKKLSNTEAELKKSVTYKKSVYIYRSKFSQWLQNHVLLVALDETFHKFH